jgi:hypothetical protein
VGGDDEARVRLASEQDSGSFGLAHGSGSFVCEGLKDCCGTAGSWAVTVRLGSFGCGTARFVSTRRGTGFVGSGTIEPRGAHDATPALTIALCSPPDAYGKADDAAAGGL